MAKDDLSVKINVGFDVNRNELDQAKLAIAAIRTEIENTNNLRLKISPSGGASGNPVALQPLEAMLKKAVSGGGKSDFKNIQLGLFERIDESLVSTAKSYIDGLNKSSKDKAVSSKEFLPAIEQINQAIDGINSRITAYAKAFNLKVNTELKFNLFDDTDLNKLESGLDVDLSSGVQKVSSMLSKLEAGLDLDESELKTAFDFQAIKDNTTLALSPAMFESLFKVIMQEAGEYVLNGNVFKGFQNDPALLKYEKNRDPKSALFQKNRFTESSETGLNNFYKELNNLDPAKINALMDELGRIANKKLEDTLLNAVKAFGKSLAGGKDFKAFAAEIQETGQSIEGFVAMESNVNNLSNNYQAFKDIVTQQEELSGFKPGTLGANIENIDIEKIVGERLTMLPQGMIEDWLKAIYKQLTTEIITHAEDASGNIVEVLNTELMSQASLPEAGAAFDQLIPQVAKRFQSFIHPYDSRQLDPLTQALEEPGIFRKGLNSESEQSLKGSITKLLNERIKRLNKEFDQAVIDVEFSEEGKALPSGRKAIDAVKPQAQDFAIDFYKAMRGGEFEQFKGELKSNLQDYEAEQNRLKDIKRFGPIEGPSDRAGGSLNPDIELLRTYLKEQKAAAEKAGEVFQIGMDTEFNVATNEKVTELGMAAVEASGKIREIFKFIQTPGDAAQMMQGWEDLPLKLRSGQAKSPAELVKRGATLGIPSDMVGDKDPQQNFLQYRAKMQKLVEVLDVIAEAGVSLTGNSFDTAEITNITKGINYINEVSKKMGLSELKDPNFGNFFDPTKNKAAYSSQEAPSELRAVFTNELGKTSSSLNDVITRIANTRPEWFKQFENQFAMNEKGTSFEYKGTDISGETKNLGAHVAMADAAASAIVVKYIKDFGGSLSTTLETVTNKINEESRKLEYSSGGGGGKLPPDSPLGGKDDQDPYANRSPDEIIKRIILTAKELEQPLETVLSTMDGLKTQYPVLAKLTAAERESLEKKIALLQSDKSADGHLQVLTELAEKEKELAAARKQMSELSQGDMGFILQQRRSQMQGPLTENQTALKKTGGVERYDRLTKEVVKLKNETDNLTKAARQNEIQAARDVVEASRKGHVTEQLTDNLRKQIDVQIDNTQAGKSATSAIKAQMQEQVSAQKAVQKQTQSLMQTWVTSRYALYDIGNFYQNVAQNLIRVSRQIFDTTQSYRRFESSFTSVERAMQLTGTAAVDMRNQFVLLSETIPVAFEEIARIGTLGAQMGIASDGIIGFTETVSKFASITGISAETVAQQFGRIAELADVDPTEFNNLGSAVAFAGINAVATEAEILNLTQSIAAVSNQAGITAPEIVGIATALASVGIASEQARGVFTRVFADIDRAASTGGESLQAFSEITGLSAETISSSWGTEGAANDVFVALLKGLNSADNLTAAFDKLNIVETREINTLTRLAKNLDVVMQALDDAGISFEDATFLGTSFDRTVDNLDSKISLFKNNLDSLAAALSSGFALALGKAIDAGSELLKFLKGLEDSLLFKAALPFGALIAAIGAGLAGFAAIAAKTTAQLYAFRVAMINTANNPTAVTGFTRQLKALMGLGSGLIEVRDQVSGINERGLIEPVAFKALFGMKAQQAELLKSSKNIYLSLGKVATEAMDKEAVKSLTSVQLARKEADAVNSLVLAKRLEIETLENSNDPAKIALASTMRQASSRSYVVAVGGEINILNERERAEYRNYIATSNMDAALKKKTLSHIDSATAINLETKAAAGGIGTAGKMASRFLGIAAIIGTVVIAFDMLSKAISNMNKIDIAEYGGGTEALREAIKQDTLAVREGTMKAIATAKLEYDSYEKSTNDVAIAVKNFANLSDDASFSVNKITKSIKSQNIALANNTKEWIANAIFNWVQDKDIDFSSIQDQMVNLNLDFEDVIAGMVAAADDSDIDPLGPLVEKIKVVQDEYDELNTRRMNAAGPDNTVMPLTTAENERLNQLNLELNSLRQLETVLEGVADTINKAFSETSAWSAIRKQLGLEEVNNGITELVDSYVKAIEKGKGMAGVFKQIQAAAKEMLPEELKEKLGAEIDAAGSIAAIIAVIDAQIKLQDELYETELAAWEANRELRRMGGDSLAISAMPVKRTSEEIGNLRSSLMAMLAAGVSAQEALDALAGSAESAADILSRLISEASSGTQKILDLRSSFRALGKTMSESSSFSFDTDLGAANINAVQSIIDSIGTKADGNFKKAERNLNVFKLSLQDMGAPQRAINIINKAIAALGGSTDITKKQAKALRKEFASLFNTFEVNFAAGASEAVEDVENKVKTLSDYVSDLSNVLRSTFDIRYGKQTALDALTGGWLSLTEAATQAQDAVKNANNEINQSVADRSVLQYQLSVAERYKDEKRSVSLRAKLAELDQKIVEQNKQLADANSAASTELTGNSKAAIDNRAKIRDLVTQYNSYLIALANTGMNSTNLNAEAAKLEKEFMSQAKALGFAEEELKSYTEAFKGDFTRVINGIPRDITLTVNTDPALRAIQEFVAKAQTELAKISVTAPAGPVTPPGQKPTEQFFNLPGLTNTRPGPEIDGKKGDIVTGPKGATWAWDNKNKEWDKIAKKAMGGYISGPGSATSDSIPAMLSNGEYVIQAGAVSAYGLDFMNALNQQRVGFNPMQGSAGVSGGGSSVVYLSPEDRALLRAAVDRPIALYTENTRIAQSANAGNVLLAQRGTN